jgi:FlaA1/EpsC-like NDP-sugar epimerase
MALPALSRRSKQFVASFTDAAMLMACLWLAVALRYGDVVPDVSTFYWVFPLPALVALPLFHRAGLYRAVNRYIGSATLFAGVRALAITALVLAAVIYFRRPFEFPRSAPPIFFLIATLYLLGSRYLLNRMAAATRARVARTAVLIYGTDEGAIRLADLLRDAGPYAVRGFADHRGAFQGGVLRDLPVLAPAQLPRFVAEQRIEAVLLTYTRARSDDRARALEVLGPLGVHVRAVPALGEIVSGMVRIEDLEQVDITDLLGRDVVSADPALIAARTRDRVVLVTGAAGSIGSELARQILMQRPRSLVLLDRHEHGLYELERELSALEGALDMSHRHTVVLMDVTDEQQLARLVAGFGVEVLFHAAAYKHVPLVEQNVATGVRNNVFGTLAVARAATAAGVQNMVLISTDKAVRPRSIMGASKRVAEICLQALAREPALAGSTVFSMVRFGNVLRSSGSVVPKFEQQIREGGPVTVTHPDVTRFFMSVEEAAQLVIQSAAMAEPGDLFLLDMGEAVRIDDLARRMVRLAGHSVRDADHPDGDIEISYTGLRPGEKLIEELLIEPTARPTTHPKILRADEPARPWAQVAPLLADLHDACARYDAPRVLALLQSIAPDTQLEEVIHDIGWLLAHPASARDAQAERAQQPPATANTPPH